VASTRRNTSVAARISSIVPTETRSCVLSGGKGRPTSTPSLRHASPNAFGSRRMSTIRKFAADGVTRYPADSKKRCVYVRASALSFCSRATSVVSSSAASAAAAPSALTLMPSWLCAMRLIVSGRATA
jgi:hypothetical protein